MSNRPVRVIVVAYGAEASLERCLGSLEGSYRVIVVDNSSSRAVREVADRRGAAYVDPGKNLGFASGVNVALRDVLDGRPADVLLLNPDAIVSTESIALLVDHLHSPGHERLAAVSPMLVGADGIPQRVLWPYPTPTAAWIEAVGFGRANRFRETFVIGAVVLLRWEAMLDVGLFDERFFLYAEEADWQRRAIDLGWTSALCSTVSASHVGAGTSQDLHTREALFHAGQETYIRKWFGTGGWIVYRAAAIVGAFVRATVLHGERRGEAARRMWLYARGPRRTAATRLP